MQILKKNATTNSNSLKINKKYFSVKIIFKKKA
jgi:hypothetical protein